MLKYISLFFVHYISMLGVLAQQQTTPKSYDEFYKKDSVALTEGVFNVYQVEQKYFLEIPDDLLDQDILTTVSTVKGTSSYVSPSSGIIYLRKSPKNKIEVYKNMVLTVSSDSSDYCMMNAIEKSGLIPVYKSYPIVAFGKKKNSSIIEITAELSGATGLFDVQENAALNAPDPERSKLEGFRMTDRGVVFSAKRVQTNSYTNGQNGDQMESYHIHLLELVFELLPKHNVALKENHAAYGFNTIVRQEYDSKRYRSFKRKYLKRWSLEASKSDQKKQKEGKLVSPTQPIAIYIDPLTPAPFRQSVKDALAAWEQVFAEAGWKDVFRFTNDQSLTYKKIVFAWGMAYNKNYHEVVVDPVTGELLAARINFMDESAQEIMYKYFVKCGVLDERIRKNPMDLEIRQLALTRLLTYELGGVLGLQPNDRAANAYTPEQCRSKNWVAKNGFTPSIMSGVVFNYLAQPEDHLTTEQLINKIGVYDREAIAYAYGKSTSGPSLKSTYFIPKNEDPMTLPKARSISSDVIAAAALGQKNLIELYAALPEITKNWPNEKNDWQVTSTLVYNILEANQEYIQSVANLVGQVTVFPELVDKNQSRYEFVSRQKQTEALRFFRDQLYSGVPKWLYVPEVRLINDSDPNLYMVGLSKNVISQLISQESLKGIISQQNWEGDEAFTVAELFDYLDEVIFNDFKADPEIGAYQLSLQTTFAELIGQELNNYNITTQLTDHATVLNAYVVKLRDQLMALKQSTTDARLHNAYELMLMRLDRNYFSKRI